LVALEGTYVRCHLHRRRDTTLRPATWPIRAADQPSCSPRAATNGERRPQTGTSKTNRNTINSVLEGQVTDRYTKAIEQLGSDKIDVRTGGIYALERIAHDSAKDHPVVMEMLTAFIREHSREQWPPPDRQGQTRRWTRRDVQAAVTVVGRRDAKHDIPDRPLDLAGD
jgi:hypothetical protein